MSRISQEGAIALSHVTAELTCPSRCCDAAVAAVLQATDGSEIGAGTRGAFFAAADPGLVGKVSLSRRWRSARRWLKADHRSTHWWLSHSG